MPTQRDIREKALAYLFAHDANSLEEGDDNSFWELSLEPEHEKITKLSIKTLKHQLQSLPKSATQVTKLADVICPMLKTYEHKAEARNLKSLAKNTAELVAQQAQLSKNTTQAELTQLYLLASSVQAAIGAFQSALSATTFSDALLPKLETELTTLSGLLSRISIIANPLEHEGDPSITNLYTACYDHDTLRTKATQLATGSLTNLETIDEAIEPILENYSEKTIGKVERTLLRLGAYEILHTDTPKAVAINESLELSRKYCTEDAVPLINGVLDQLSS